MADTIFTNPYEAGRTGPTQPKSALSKIEDISRSTQVPANILIAIAERTGAQDENQQLAVATRAAEQIAPRIAAGEKIEDIIVSGAADERTGQEFLERARMIGHELYPDRVPKDPFEGESLMATAARRGQQFISGAAEPFASIPEAAAIARAASDDKDTPASEMPGYDRGQQIRESVGEADWRDESFWGKLSMGAGNMVGMAGGTIAGALAGGPAAPVTGLATGAALGSSMNTSAMYREALESGADEDSAELAAKWGAAIGASEVIPIARALKVIPPKTRNKIANLVGRRANDIIRGAGEEAAQEYLATVANNVVSQKIYDPERGWTEGATESALIGTILGGGMGAAGSFMGGREQPGQDPEAVPPVEGPEEGPAQPGEPLALSPPPLVTPPPGREGERAQPAPPPGTLSSALQDAPAKAPEAPEATEAPAAPPAGGLAARAAGQVQPPAAEDPMRNDEPQTPEEARRRAAAVEDVARSQGWNRRTREVHQALLAMADEMEGAVLDTDTPAEPEPIPADPAGVQESAPEPTETPTETPAAPEAPEVPAEQPERIGKKDGSPFGNAAAAKRGLKSRGLDPDGHDLIEADGGVYAFPKQETATDAEPLAATDAAEPAPAPEPEQPAAPAARPAAEPVADVAPEPDAPQAAPDAGVERKRDGSPFKSVDAAWTALTRRGLALSDFEVVPEGDGYIARPKTEASRGEGSSVPGSETAQEGEPGKPLSDGGPNRIRKATSPGWRNDIEKARRLASELVPATRQQQDLPPEVWNDQDKLSEAIDTYLDIITENSSNPGAVAAAREAKETGAATAGPEAPRDDQPKGPRVVINRVGRDGKTDAERGGPLPDDWQDPDAAPSADVTEQAKAKAKKAPKDFWGEADEETRRQVVSEVDEAADTALREWKDLDQKVKRRISKQYRSDPEGWERLHERNRKMAAPADSVAEQAAQADPEPTEAQEQDQGDGDAPASGVADPAAEAPRGDPLAGETPAADAGDATTGATGSGEAEGSAAPDAEQAPAYGASNRLVSADRAAELRARLKDKLKNQLNAGIDPEIMAIGAELAVYHIEAGARQFTDLARVIAADLDTTPAKLRPYLRSFYNGARDLMEDSGVSVEGMDDASAVAEILRSGALDAEPEGGTPDETSSAATDRTVPDDAEASPGPGGTGTAARAEGESGPGDLDTSPSESLSDRVEGAQGEETGNVDRDVVQEGERETRGDDAAGEQDGARPDPALAGEQPEDGGSTDRGTGPAGDSARAGGSDAGSVEGVQEGGDAADGRPGTGGARVASEGARERPVPAAARPNYVISDPETVMGGTPMVRFKRNQAAIEAFNDIVADGRSPTPEELDSMAGYTGWGSFGQELFQGSWSQPRPKEGWEARDEWMREHLGEDAWKSAQASIINAHYTDPPTVRAMWAMVEAMGFKGGRVLEPSMGIGNFFGLMPQGLAKDSDLTGIELDRTTGGMAKLLYPQANISIKGYEKSRTPDGFYDLVIGNWPFARQGPADRRYNKLNPSLHDYFFVKALDQVRAGGLVVGVTSSGTMDKAGTATRDHIARKADLVAAYRLPTGAFQEYAGTKVVTDILVFRKREEPRMDTRDAGWINAVEMDTPAGSPIRVNEYYHAHPENVLGTLDFGAGTMQGRAGMIVHRPDDLVDRLEGLAGRVPEGVFSEAKRGTEERFITNNTEDRVGSVVVAENDLWVAQGERLAPLSSLAKWEIKDQKKTAARRAALTSLVDLRKKYGAVIDAERDGAADTETKRKALNKAYKAFRKDHGTIQDSDAIKIMAKAGDPNVPMLEALERADGTPSDVLTKPLVRSRASIENPTVSDAFVVARNENATLDLDRVAELAGVPVEQAASELLDRKAIYRMPGNSYEIADLFLSGNVRRRLRQLEAARDEGEEGLEDSIEAVKAVVPDDIPYYKIEANMGAVWMGGDVFKDFTAEILGLTEAQAESLNINFIGGSWQVKIEDRSIIQKPEATTQHGTTHTKFDRILRGALNNESLKVFGKDEEGNRVLDADRTKEANEKAEKLRETFKDWVFRDPERRVDLAASYNEQMNAIADASFDGSFLEFPGMALRRGDDPFSLRSHQANAIWRGIAKGRGLYAHEVGTGKTYTMGGIAVESRRYGLARKPMIVAHNANSATVAAEINEMYPGAKILYVGSLGPKEIKRTLYSIRNDDWDAVVIPHSLLDRMALSQDTLEAMTAEEIAALETAALEAATEDGVDLTVADMNDDDQVKKIRSVTAKDLVKARNALIAKVQKNAERAAKEDAVTFEDLGVDMLLIDEIHEFKKPSFVTKMQMKGLQKQTSARAIQLQFLTKYVRQMNGGKGVHAFTGTPITNTLTEMFHQMRYVMEDTMSDNAVDQWDGWFNTFAMAEGDLEIASDGQFETVTRLSSFVNVAELRRMAGEYLDIVFADDMPEFKPRETAGGKTMADKLTDAEMDELRDGRTENPIGRPYKKTVNDVAPMNPAQEAVQRDLARRYNTFRQASPRDRANIIKAKAGTAEAEFNPLIISLEADAAAFDIRLRRPDREDHPESKINRAIANVLTHYREHPQASQVIFMDKGYENFGTEGGERVPRLNAAQDIKEKLVAGGMKPAEIAIVTGSTSKEKRKQIAQRMNTAELRVVIGGTSTLGVGVNMQRNLRAMHHLDAPWMPGELEQRNGRGQRQGNQWNTVMEYRYMTERLDAKRWQTLAKKQRFITDFMRADMETRIIDGDAVDAEESSSGDDITESLSEAAGDPRIFQSSKLAMQIDKLERRKATHEAGMVDSRRRVRALEREIERLGEDLPQRRDDAAHVAAIRETGDFTATIDGKTYDNRKDAEDALNALLETWKVPASAYDSWVDVPAEVQGFKLQTTDGYRQWWRIARGANYEIGKGSLKSMEAGIRGVPAGLEHVEGMIADKQQSAERLKRAAEEPFAQSEALESKKAQLAAVREDMEANPIPAPAWLRQGTPTDTKIMVDGEPAVVIGHRWGPDDYYVLTEGRDVPYREARGEDGAPIYDEMEWKEPPEAAERNTEGEQEGGAKERRGDMTGQETRITDADLRAIEAEAAQELRALGISKKVSLLALRGLANRGWFGRYERGTIGVRVEASEDAAGGWRGTLDHEAVHALRDPALWNRPYGLFEPAEWRSLVRAARADEAIRGRVETDYPDLSTRDQSEEMVAELYREWAEGRRAAGGVAKALEKMRAFFTALANGLRGQGFVSAAGTLDAIASGRVGRRSATGTVSDTAASRPVGTATPRFQRAAAEKAPSERGFTPRESNRVSQVLSDAMGGQFGLLSMVPGRPLFAELARRIPSAGTYLKLKERMDTERQDWHARTDEVAQAWRKLISKNGEANKRLMDIMHRATIHQVDPSQPFEPHATPQDKQLANSKGYAGESARKRLKEDIRRKRQYARIKAEFDALPADMRKMFGRVRDAYTEMADAFDDAIIDNIVKSADIALARAERAHSREMQRIKDARLTGMERDEAVEAADLKLKRARAGHRRGKGSRIGALRAAFESNRLKGPYFPLARFGRYFATVRDADGTLVSFSRFETEKEQTAFAREARKEGGNKVTIGVLDESGDLNSKMKEVAPTFIADIESILGDANVDDATMDAVWQRWLETLPDTSIRTSRIHRQNVEGYDTDAFRAFGKAMFHGSHQHARLKYATEMQEALEKAREEVAETDDPNRNGMVVTEMERRHEFTMNPTGSGWAQYATSAAFIYYLGVTPAAAIVNLSQTSVVGIPVLAAGFPKGSMAQASRQLARAGRDFFSGRFHAENSRHVTAAEKAAMKEAYERGVVDRTQSHDLAGVAETGVEYSAVRTKVMGYISAFFHHAERMNREVTFLAAYRMAKAHGADHMKAIDKASDLTWKTHFDYQNSSRPRLLQNDPAKVLLVFRNFQINMLYRLFRDTHQALKGATAEERREARVQLGGITMMMMLHAGITGTWGYALTTMLLGMFFDEGKDEVERELQEGLVSLFGKDIAGMMLKGVPGHLTKTDLTGRLGMPELWFRSSDRQLEGDDVYNYWLAEMVGPVPGMAENLVRGVQKIGQGEYQRGIETTAPKFIRDLMQSYRYLTEGVTTYNGDPIVDQLSAYQALVEAMGFTPAEVSEAYDRNTKLKNAEKRIMDERSRLHRQIGDDIKEGGRISAKTMGRMLRFNQANPEYPITGDTIRRSMGARQRMSDRNEGGVALNPRLNERLRREQAPGLYQ